MTAKRLQSKLFGAASKESVTPKELKHQDKAQPQDKGLKANEPAAEPKKDPRNEPKKEPETVNIPETVAADLDDPSSGAATPVSNPHNLNPVLGPDGAPLRIDIPRPPAAASAAKLDNVPKKTARVAEDKTPPVHETKDSPREPKTGASDPDTPLPEHRRRQSLRDRLLDTLGSNYRSVENYRLEQADRYEKHWKRWGPYLAERQWGTVREDYSANGDAWNSFPFSMSKSRAYRWGEDGIAGISDNHQRLCFALALWNGKDDILKERLFGVTGEQANHGEDVKEIYYYLDSSPTHSYMKYLYKYPQAKYPYQHLMDENGKRSREDDEYELIDTGLFDEDRYWDVFVEYAKDEEDENSISIRVTAYNRGPEKADLHILPQLWFRNTWSWLKELPPNMPVLKQVAEGVVEAAEETLGQTRLYCTPSPAPAAPTRGGVVLVDGPSVVPNLLFTENETNFERLYGGNNRTPYTKDAFHDYVIPSHRPPMPKAPESEPTTLKGERKTETEQNGAHNGGGVEGATAKLASATINGKPTVPDVWPADKFVNPGLTGTKAAAHYAFPNVPGRGGCVVVRLKLTPNAPSEDPSILDEELFDDNIEARRLDTDEFYSRLGRGPLTDDLRSVMRQALAGMLWTKQYYRYIQKEWIEGDPGQPPPPAERKWGRNREWRHMYIDDVLSMPDKWEYPWFATWDTAFHCIPLALVDPSFAKKQLDLMTREWYMKPDGALPAYEWNFSDVNPPVHAWATFRVFKIERKEFGREDLDFLERVFQKLLLNFTWWTNRKDPQGNNVFEGGFLGLDNIGPFNRSEPLPTGGTLHQADGTSWMAFFCLNMLSIALELAKHNPTYEDIASKFFEHFLYIADAASNKESDDQSLSLWDDETGFYYDAIQWSYGNATQLPVRSMVGLMPLYATLVLEPQVLKRFPGFKKRLDWFVANRPDISQRNIASLKHRGRGDRLMLALASKERLTRILEKMLDQEEFLADHGIRSLSRYHEKNPFRMDFNGGVVEVPYWPGDSRSGMFGGNSNWRGPIWLCVNALLIESLQRFQQFYGNDLIVECPTGSGDHMNLAACAEEIQHRLIHIFARDEYGRRAVNGGHEKFDHDPHFSPYVHFYEFFHGNTGKGLGASHQTGWTGLVAFLIHQTGEFCRLPKTPKTPRAFANHYFGDAIQTPASEWGESSTGAPFSAAPFSAYTDGGSIWEPEPDEL